MEGEDVGGVGRALKRVVLLDDTSASSGAYRLMMPPYPFRSLAIFAIDILALYGLIAYVRSSLSETRVRRGDRTGA